MDWEQFKDQWDKPENIDYSALLKDFISSNPGWLDILQEKIKTSDWNYVVWILGGFEPEYSKPFFESLVYYACVEKHGTIPIDLINRLDKSWVVKKIREPIKSILLSESENSEVYYKALALLATRKSKQTDEFAHEMAEKAIMSKDRDIQEAGKWAIDYIEKSRGEAILTRGEFIKQLEETYITNLTYMGDKLVIDAWDVWAFTTFVPPKILEGGQSWEWQQPGYNDKLISLISSRVVTTDLNEDEKYFRLISEEDVELLISWDDPDIKKELFNLKIDSYPITARTIKEPINLREYDETFSILELSATIKSNQAVEFRLDVAEKSILTDYQYRDSIRHLKMKADKFFYDGIEIFLTRDDFIQQLEQDSVLFVGFGKDTATIGFNVGPLSTRVPLKILERDQNWLYPQSGYYDKLISLISYKVVAAELNYDEKLFRLILEQDVELSFSWDDPPIDFDKDWYYENWGIFTVRYNPDSYFNPKKPDFYISRIDTEKKEIVVGFNSQKDFLRFSSGLGFFANELRKKYGSEYIVIRNPNIVDKPT